MVKYTSLWANHLRRVAVFLPFANPTFGNPDFQTASYRVLIVRLSPFRDVDRSISHLFLFQEIRRALPSAFVDMAFFPSAGERALFEREDIPYLIGIQSLRPATEFDLVLISNAYTLELINLPYLLIRSGIPLFSSQRRLQKAKVEWPIIILGGSNAMATQPIIREDGDSLVDGIFFGEGEGLAGDLRFLEPANQLYRGKKARTRPGIGLGLSIAKALIEAQNGTIAVESQVEQGSVITVTLPQAARP